MTDLRLLYQLNAYDYFQEELWNALDDVRHRFDPDRIGYWTGHVFADFPGRGFRDTPGYREIMVKGSLCVKGVVHTIQYVSPTHSYLPR